MAENILSHAVKIAIAIIHRSRYVQGEGWAQNYLLPPDNRQLALVNVVAVVIYKQREGKKTNINIDDGSGKKILLCFEEMKQLTALTPGDAMLVIGRVREYNNEKYISPMILRSVNQHWLRVRALELQNEQNEQQEYSSEQPKEMEEEHRDDEEMIPTLKLLKMVEHLDKGDGVPVDEILDRSPLNNTEELIRKMIENGELFQNQPGRVKVL
jgi:RPA family protein